LTVAGPPSCGMRDHKLLAQARRHHHQRARTSCDGNEARFAWLHVPKTGSSLATALFHAANASLPSSARLPVCTHDGFMRKAEVPWRNVSTRSLCRRISRRGQMVTTCEVVPTERCRGGQAELAFLERFPMGAWFRCQFWEHNDGNVGSHAAIDEESYTRYKGKFVGMFRSPLTRVASSFLWFASSFPAHARPNASTYAQRVAGTATKMLAGQSDGMACGSGFGPLPAAPRDRQSAEATSACGLELEPDSSLAVHRLRNGFAFVGLTEQWALSICLFHAIFGGPCHAVEFENARPSRATEGFWRRRELAEAIAAAAALPDPYDEAIYAEARSRFLRDVAEYRLSTSRCRALCPDAPRDAQFELLVLPQVRSSPHV
jgi:hypothetical protein